MLTDGASLDWVISRKPEQSVIGQKGAGMGVKLSVATGIFRGYTYEQVKAAAEVLLDSRHVRNMEITLNTEGVFDTIRRIADEYGDRLNVGAGTVLDIEGLKRAADCGARFVLAPDMMTAEMIDFCRENDIVSVPGAYTPSEIRECFHRGCDVVKVFPANELSHSYAKKVCEPMGNLPLMAVGGVNADNVVEVIEGGYAYVGTAGGIFKKADLLACDEDALRASLETFDRELDKLTA